MSRPIRVIDRRNKHYFVVDDIYLNGYAKHLGPIVTVVYLSLCRHVDKDQAAFPSQEKMAEELGIGRRSVENSISILKRWNLVDVERDRSANHGWARNSYLLLDKSVWKELPPALTAGARPPAPNYVDHPHQVLIKDTHIKDTHTLSSIGDLDFENVANFYNVPVSFVKSKYDDLANYCQRTGKTYKNYLAALRNFVKQDAMKVRKEAIHANSKHGIDARYL